MATMPVSHAPRGGQLRDGDRRCYLERALNRPDAQLKLVLVPGESDSLDGINATSRTSTSGDKEESQMMLNAKKVHLTRVITDKEAHPAVPGWSICSMKVPCAGDRRRAGGIWGG